MFLRNKYFTPQHHTHCFTPTLLPLVYYIHRPALPCSPDATRAEIEPDQLNQVGPVLVPQRVHSGGLTVISIHVEQCIRHVVALRVVDLGRGV